MAESTAIGVNGPVPRRSDPRAGLQREDGPGARKLPGRRPSYLPEVTNRTLPSPAGIYARRLSPPDAVLAEAGGRIVVPGQDHVHERTHALGSPLQAVEVVVPEHVSADRGPEAAVIGMGPARPALSIRSSSSA